MTKKRFLLLLEKNLIVEFRCYVQTLIEIITIAIIFFILFQLKTQETVRKPQFQKDIKLNDLSQFRNLMLTKGANIPTKLYFAPITNYTHNIFKIAAKNLQLSEAVGFDNEHDMIEHFNASSTLAGVILEGNKIILRFPNYFRTRPNKKFFSSQDFWLTNCRSVFAGDGKNDVDYYIREGFLQLLLTVSDLLLKSQMEEENASGNSVTISSIWCGNEPKLNCVNDTKTKALTSARYLKWSLYYFIYFIPFINIIWKLSREHEENVFVHHSVYGISLVSQRFAHFIVSLCHLILLDVVVFIPIMFLWPSLPGGKSVLLFLFIIIFNMLLILYAMTLSSLIKNSKTAVWCGATIWITSYALFLEISNAMNFDIIKPTFFIISLIFFNNLFPTGLMDYFEEGNNESLKEIFIFLGGQYVILLIYGCVFKYVEFRHIKHFRKKDLTECKNSLQFICKLNGNHFEYGPLNGEILQLKNVYSCCDNLQRSIKLKNISLRIFKNEISVILGPHRSGKTDFIRILAGWQSFRGLLAYQRQNVNRNWSHYRLHVDVCLSNNPLFDMLTAQETLKYFILLKQTDSTHLKAEQEKWLEILTPIVKRQKLVKSLSFGEKRILALCCTMVCNTSVILLDEPTAHMRSEEQSSYWSILKKEKKNRAVIVTTDNVDEANEIADRIGILHDGCLRAWGSSYFLRTKCDGRFYLVCLLQPMKSVEPVTEFLEKYIQNIKTHNHFLDRIIYILPADKRSVFQRLLIDLEKNFSKLGITNIYITGTSLNEVYMNLTAKLEVQNHLPNIKKTLKCIDAKKSRLNCSTIPPLLYKKLLCQSKDFLPVCVIFIAFFMILAISRMPPASLSVDRLTFSGQGVLKNSKNSLMEIVNVEDVENGLFRYENVEYSNDTFVNRSTMNCNSLAGLELKEPTAWINRRIFHSAPLALNLAFNFLNNTSIYVNKPIILWRHYDIHLMLGVVMPLTTSTVFVKLQEERFSHMWTLQKLACPNDKTQWSVTFLWDISTCFLNSLLYLIILITCVMDTATCLMVIVASMLLFLSGIASLLLIYLMFLFIKEENKTRAYIKIFLLQLSLGLLPFVLYIHILEEYSENFFYAFLMLPGFSALQGTTKIFDNNEKLNLSSYFQWNSPGVLDSITCISLTSFTYFTIFVAVIIYRRNYLKSIPKKMKQLASVCYPYDDERVVKERVRISNMNLESCRTQAVLVDQLEYKLPNRGNHVKSISFALNKNVCLGIYGSNNSGKSHLLKQLVGAEGYWFGEVYIAGFDAKKQMADALKNIGYCPQNKGYNGLLTPSELLKLFLMMYGVNASDHLDCLRDLSLTLQLRKYMNSRIKDLPENIKRRINVAVALTSNKKILAFDEPTRGLPAFDRLLIWNTIKYCRSLEKTIIFTTTESIELKELADFVVTVNDGEMLSYDNPHNMEYQCSAGFYLEIKLYSDGLTLEEVAENLNNDVENLNRFVMFFHAESELIYRCVDVCKYFVPVEHVIYSYIFGTIEKNRNRLNIADYTLAPFSLTKILKSLQKSRKEKIRPKRARASLLRDARTLPRRY